MGEDGLEQLDTEELKFFISFLGTSFQHLLNNLFPTHGKLVQQMGATSSGVSETRLLKKPQ